MEQELISKKDLLVETGISYGQLYRWKRKKLIPEEWFIRKATFTGQETFFPKAEVLGRIDKIKSMKDDLSLDEMADVFTVKTGPLPAFFTKDFLLERNIVTFVVLEQFAQQTNIEERFTFGQVFVLYLIERMLKAGEISRAEGDIIYQTMDQHLPAIIHDGGELVFIRKMGVPVVAIVSPASHLFFDADVRLIAKYSLSRVVEELKGILQGGKTDGE